MSPEFFFFFFFVKDLVIESVEEANIVVGEFSYLRK